MLLFTLDHKSFEVKERERSLNAEKEMFHIKGVLLLGFTQPFGLLIIIHGVFSVIQQTI